MAFNVEFENVTFENVAFENFKCDMCRLIIKRLIAVWTNNNATDMNVF